MTTTQAAPHASVSPRQGRMGEPTSEATEGRTDPGARLTVAQVLVGFRPDGGAEQVVRTLLQELRTRSGAAVVVTLKHDAHGSADELRALGAELVPLPARRLIDPVRFVRLVRALRRARVDVVHTHLTGANVVGVVAARLLRIPSVVTLHSTASAADDHWYHGRLERFVLHRLATKVLAVGEETAAAQAPRIRRSDIVVLPNAVTPSPAIEARTRAALRGQVMADPSRRLLLTVGRLELPKAHDDLIAAFELLCAGRDDVELAIVGRGSLWDDTEALVKRSGLADRVHFLGVRDDVRALMQSADVFVLSSRWEGLPMVLLEAMECRLPIVSTDVGDVATVLAPTPGRVVPVGAPCDLAAAISATLADLDEGRDLTSAGAALVRERYSSTAWADALLGQYDAVRR